MRRANYVYGSAKAGLDGFCSGLADALHGSGVRLLLVRPGFVIGRMTEGMSPAPFSSTPPQVADRDGAGIVERPPDACGCRRCWGRCSRMMRLLPQFIWRRMPRMIIVVGIGADGMSGLAQASRAELAKATVIYGSRRQLDLLDEQRHRGQAGMADADAARPAHAAGRGRRRCARRGQRRSALSWGRQLPDPAVRRAAMSSYCLTCHR